MGSPDDLPLPVGVSSDELLAALRRRRFGRDPAHLHLDLLASLFELTAAVGESFVGGSHLGTGAPDVVAYSRPDVDTFSRMARHMADIVRSVGVVDMPLMGETFGADLRYLAELADVLDGAEEPAGEADAPVVVGGSAHD